MTANLCLRCHQTRFGWGYYFTYHPITYGPCSDCSTSTLIAVCACTAETYALVPVKQSSEAA